MDGAGWGGGSWRKNTPPGTAGVRDGATHGAERSRQAQPRSGKNGAFPVPQGSDTPALGHRDAESL